MSLDTKTMKNNIDELMVILKQLVESYRLLVGAAEEFNRITLAHKKDLSNAIDRADNLGDIIDDIIDTLDSVIDQWLTRVKKNSCKNFSTPAISEDSSKGKNHSSTN